ncbi:MAG: MFS transporter [Chloroflexi bacterium]|nr:MFS transporter [Chloroflexota bacterium]
MIATRRPAVAPRSQALSAGFRRTFESLGNFNFALLWISMLFLMAGTQMQMLAQGYLAYEITGSGTILGVISLGIAVPLLTVPLFGGALADKIDRKLLIQGAQLVAALLALVLGVMIHAGIISWQHLLISSMVQGALFSFMMPARQAIIPQLVGQNRLSNAMALNAAGMSAMTMGAPAVAGFMYDWAGPWNLYYFIAALSFISVVLTGLIKPTGDPIPKKQTAVMRDIWDGITYIARQRILVVLLVVGLITTILAMPFRFILPVFVVDIYRQEADSMGLLTAIMGFGAMAGAMYVAAIGRKNRGMLLIISSMLSGAGLLLVAAIPIYSAAAFIMVILGMGDAGRMSLNQALLIELSDNEYRGRVMSIFMLNFGFMPLGTFPAGLMIDYIGGQAVIGMMGVALIAVTVVIFVTQRQLRGIA